MFDRLDHVTIAVADLAAAQRTYVSILGRTPSWQDGHPARGARSVRFRLANTQIELATPDGAGERGDALRSQLDERGEGLHGIALGTPDLAAAVKQLHQRGMTVPEPESAISQDGPSGAWLRWKETAVPLADAGGVRIQLLESLSSDAEIPPSLPIGDAAGTASRLDHVVIFSEGADDTRALYGDALNIRLALDREFPKRNARILFFRIGGATIEIGAKLNADPEATSSSDCRDRLFGLAHQVPDIELAYARLSEAGLVLDSIRDGHKAGTRVFTIQGGCHGVPTLMIQPVETPEPDAKLNSTA